jgi:hypothetical protein
MIRRNRKLFVHLLSLALLFAQFGMVAHASAHLDSDPHAVPKAAQLCGECLSFSPLQNIVGPAPAATLFVKIPAERVYEGDAIEAVPPRAFSAFRSRAPPSFL